MRTLSAHEGPNCGPLDCRRFAAPWIDGLEFATLSFKTIKDLQYLNLLIFFEILIKQGIRPVLVRIVVLKSEEKNDYWSLLVF